jgi:hypothetical protein
MTKGQESRPVEYAAGKNLEFFLDTIRQINIEIVVIEVVKLSGVPYCDEIIAVL